MLYRLGHAWSTTCHHRARDGLGAARVMRHFFPGGLPGAVSVLTSSVILPASAGPLVSRPCVPKAVTPRLIAASLRAVHLAPVAVRADVRHLLAATAVKTTAIRVKFVHGRYPAWTSFTASAILVPAGFVPGQRGSFFFSGFGSPSHFSTVTSTHLAHARDDDPSSLPLSVVSNARMPRFLPADYIHPMIETHPSGSTRYHLNFLVCSALCLLFRR